MSVDESRTSSPCRGSVPPSPEHHSDQKPAASSPLPPPPAAAQPGRRYRYRSIVSDVFDGRILSSVQCLTCNGVSSTRETFQDLSLPIPSREHLSVLQAQAGRPVACASQLYGQQCWVSWLWSWLASWLSGPSVSLHHCLASFFSADELKGDNMYSCGRCRKLRNGVKYCRVVELPEVLTIHLKRFRHDFVFSSKLGTYVQFPLEGLDMSVYLHKQSRSEVCTYDLAAVICHHGTAGAGHYTAYALNHASGTWYEYDDQFVTEVSAETVANCQAYVLFYRKSCAASDQRRQRATELIARSRSDPSLLPYFISRQWINKFNTFAEPGPIDNTDFLCPHGGVLPGLRVPVREACVRLPQAGWEYLHASLGGGPVANALFDCAVCRGEWEALLARQRRELTELRQLQTAAPAPSHAISAGWFRRWEAFARGREMEPPGRIDNTNIVTVRNGLAQVRAGSDHVQISSDMWTYLKCIYDGGPELPLVPRTVAGSDPTPTAAPRHEQPGTQDVTRSTETASHQHHQQQQSKLPEVHRRTVPKSSGPEDGGDSSTSARTDRSPDDGSPPRQLQTP